MHVIVLYVVVEHHLLSVSYVNNLDSFIHIDSLLYILIIQECGSNICRAKLKKPKYQDISNGRMKVFGSGLIWIRTLRIRIHAFFLDWIQKYKLIPDHFLHCFCLRFGIRLLNPDPDTENFENRQKHRIRNPGRMINDSVHKASAP